MYLSLMSNYKYQHFSFFQGYTNLVRYLVSQGANVNAQTKFDEYTALIFAAYYGHFDVEKILIQNGADVSRTNSNGYSALILSANYGDAEIVKLLIEVIFTNISQKGIIKFFGKFNFSMKCQICVID